MKLLILIGIAYLAYRGLKSWLLQGRLTRDPANGRQAKELDDIMVKDPYCDAYFPKRNGVLLRHRGEDLWFCSPECRDKFSEQHSQEST